MLNRAIDALINKKLKILDSSSIIKYQFIVLSNFINVGHFTKLKFREYANKTCSKINNCLLLKIVSIKIKN
jgi:hypothetical protein